VSFNCQLNPPGLNPTISKNRKKILFSVYTGKFQKDKFSGKTEKNSAQIFWCRQLARILLFCFCKFFIGT
jgi:hypothetical protein